MSENHHETYENMTDRQKNRTIWSMSEDEYYCSAAVMAGAAIKGLSK